MSAEDPAPKPEQARDPAPLGEKLAAADTSIAERMRLCFELKQIGGEAALKALERGMAVDSELLKHEICYVMGQMRDTAAIPFLTAVLKDQGEAPIVRHEAGEALAAIGNLEVLDLLREYAKDPCRDVAETCQLAVDGMEWQQANKKLDKSQANSVDPAPAFEGIQGLLSNEVLHKMYLDQDLSLFRRYRAMFTLRGLGTTAAAMVLAEGLKDPSALFRHEVAFVLGQMIKKETIPALIEVVRNGEEVGMVRHEAAEALGNIAGFDTEDSVAVQVLKEHLGDPEAVLRESCVVALDMTDFWQNPDDTGFVDVK